MTAFPSNGLVRIFKPVEVAVELTGKCMGNSLLQAAFGQMVLIGNRALCIL